MGFCVNMGKPFIVPWIVVAKTMGSVRMESVNVNPSGREMLVTFPLDGIAWVVITILLMDVFAAAVYMIQIAVK